MIALVVLRRPFHFTSMHIIHIYTHGIEYESRHFELEWLGQWLTARCECHMSNVDG